MIQKAVPSDSGIYRCEPSNANPSSIKVHVVNGEPKFEIYCTRYMRVVLIVKRLSQRIPVSAGNTWSVFTRFLSPFFFVAPSPSPSIFPHGPLTVENFFSISDPVRVPSRFRCKLGGK